MAENASRPLNLIWKRQELESVLESYFIKEILLAAIPRPIRTIAIEPNSPVPLFDDSIYFSFNNSFAKLIEEARNRGCRNLGLFHIGDETGVDKRDFYGHADYVLRHYWFKEAVALPNERSLGAIWVPNGYRTGVGPLSSATMLSAGDRTIMGFFSGVITDRKLSGERQNMVAVTNEAKLPFLVMQTPGFGQGFGPTAYAAYLSSSRFALVPGGNSPETIRLYDALEAGAIPVMLKSPFVSAVDALNNPPFLVLDSWRDLPMAYAPYADSGSPQTIARLNAKQREVCDWWVQFKRAQQDKVAALVERSFARSG